MTGVTNSREAAPGTIRGDLGMSLQCNVVHTSESVDVAESEVARFFTIDELHDYEPPSFSVVYAADVQPLHVLGELKDTIACDISRARHELGYDPPTELLEG